MHMMMMMNINNIPKFRRDSSTKTVLQAWIKFFFLFEIRINTLRNKIMVVIETFV